MGFRNSLIKGFLSFMLRIILAVICLGMKGSYRFQNSNTGCSFFAHLMAMLSMCQIRHRLIALMYGDYHVYFLLIFGVITVSVCF